LVGSAARAILPTIANAQQRQAARAASVVVVAVALGTILGISPKIASVPQKQVAKAAGTDGH
jgi:predicted dinucleotide-binding enzyme